MTTIIPGTEAAQVIGIKMLMTELGFEINTGMKRGRGYSPLATAKSLGFTGRTKIDALVWLVNTTGIEPGATAMKALEKHGYVADRG